MKFVEWKMLLVLALAGAGIGHAQGVRPGREPSTPEHIRILARYSNCVAHEWPGQARRVLDMDFRTAEYVRELRGLAFRNSSCLDHGELSFSALLFAGGMAEQLLRENGTMDELPARVGFDPARPPFVARDETELMSLCVVRAAPAEVAALLQSGPASPAEAEAMRALAPRLGECLGAGQQLRVNRTAIRSLLALAAYRLGTHNGWGRAAASGGSRGG